MCDVHCKVGMNESSVCAYVLEKNQRGAHGGEKNRSEVDKRGNGGSRDTYVFTTTLNFKNYSKF